ncbi:MAG: hypothetical protein GVY06_08905 [Alphaproteobacteria bacterium]|jgi:hypothetical protein|nr:hypothetical protein [Alphaproteobacteria bacterium]
MRVILAAILFGLFSPGAGGEIRPDAALIEEAKAAAARWEREIDNGRYLSIIDYRKPSSVPRFFLLDLQAATIRTYRVAHGRGSDRDHDGYAERFSNIPNSKMSSLGAYITGETYQGRHGLSLRLKGLDASNDKAEARAIVIHGADYVSPDRALPGRSWGCPALAQDVARELIPDIAGGSFLYIVGNENQ